jgi:hypothetical protein
MPQENVPHPHEDPPLGVYSVFAPAPKLPRLVALPSARQAEPPPRDHLARKQGSRLWGRLAAGLTVLALGLVLFPGVLIGSDGFGAVPPLSVHARVLLLIGAALPCVLARLIDELINRRALRWPFQPRVTGEIDACLDPVRERAETIWSYEMDKAHWSLARAEVFAAMWGTVASLAIASSLGVLLLTHALEPARAALAARIAFAVVGATWVSFLLELSRLSIRTADDDATRRMFAEALRALILAIVSTLVLTLLPSSFEMPMDLLGNPSAALGFGGGVAILGPPAYEWVRARLAAFFGFEQKRSETGTPLDTLGDIGSAELARLSEEGIGSVEALVNTPIPRLFLSTRFSLQRLVNWHDFGLLVTRIGAGPAADLRTRWGLRGSVEVRRIVLGGGDEGAKAVLRGIFKKTMRVDGENEAELVIQRIARDDRVALVEVLRHTVLERNSERPAPISVRGL